MRKCVNVETRNPEPGTRNPEPGTRNPAPGPRLPAPGSRSPLLRSLQRDLPAEAHVALLLA